MNILWTVNNNYDDNKSSTRFQAHNEADQLNQTVGISRKIPPEAPLLVAPRTGSTCNQGPNERGSHDTLAEVDVKLLLLLRSRRPV